MAHARKQLPVIPGEGELRYRGFRGQVEYQIQGEPSSLRFGPARLRGALTASPEIAEDAFRQGEGQLVLENGSVYRITMLGHTAGSGTAYFEMRI
ncbi:hypothetical protein [Phenylobacterium sp.]|uniref:hypothetical protein n=1 Tax=Phenylobacterium sp. TaxID=1871053 RepID=UPI0035AE5F40